MGCAGKSVIAFVVLALVMVVLWCTWLVEATGRRDAAWERLRAAGIATNVEELKAQLEPVLEASNPAPAYEGAWALVDEDNEAWTAWTRFRIAAEERTPEEQAEYEKLEQAVVEGHRNVLDAIAVADGRVRPAVERVRADFGVWSERNGPLAPDMISIPLPHLNHLRNLAKLTAAEANVAGSRGDGSTVVKSAIRIIGMAESLDSDTHTIVEHRLALSFRSLAANAVIDNPTVADAPPETSQMLITLLLDDQPSTAGHIAGLRGEVTMHQSVVSELEAGRLSDDDAGLFGPLARPMMRHEATLMARHMLEGCDGIAQDRLPHAREQLPGDQWIEQMQSPLSGILPSLEGTLEVEYLSRTDRRMAAVTLAIHSYQRDHGDGLPPNLDTLVPDYLPAVPIDPMAAEGDLKYDPDRALLWSVGADGVNDGGDETAEEETTHRWMKKDVVVRLRP